MKLPITSLVIIAVGFGLFGWINATPLSTVDSVENFSKETSTSSDNFLVYVNSSGLFTLPFSKKNKNLSEIEITDSSSFSGTFDSKNSHNKEFTISCANNNIYILKKSKEDERKVLDIINYNDNNEFKRINQVSDMFNNATSIASDRKTGNIYWIECNNKKQYSIKVTNESFKESKYIINPRKEIAMSVIHIYPKRDEIFFAHTELWYYSNYSTSFNHRPQGLFDGLRDEIFVDFAIDYVLDKLCWIALNYENSELNCVDISTSSRPINSQDVVFIKEIPNFATNLAVFNNTFYWIAYERNEGVLYFYNGQDEPVKVVGSNQNDRLSFLSSDCSH
ncbi:uncharacterized protein LOC122851016 [Aphidius gifuensis]|uniref:uncharacterized protein LOC122851016 n=1 Tax=Aphidius gifuensis TaxID=684658 RepID=UPI001CDD5689|nr:uncharacterized protein LOC122851016 [Aphidius gifuensis]